MTWRIDQECRDAEEARQERNWRVFGHMSEQDLNRMHDYEDQCHEEYCEYLDDLERENPIQEVNND